MIQVFQHRFHKIPMNINKKNVTLLPSIHHPTSNADPSGAFANSGTGSNCLVSNQGYNCHSEVTNI